MRVLLGLSTIALLIAVTVASFRLFWFDELVTLYIAKTGSLRAIWHAIANGADPNPPLTHLLVSWSMSLFGENHFSVRLPAIVAGMVGVVGLFVFLKRRLPIAFSALGVLFYLSTRAFDYSYESRSYALTLCFCMLALLLWRAAVEGRHQILASVGLALSLAAGISSNYFAVLACFPIAAGELVLAWERRRIELRVWLALLFGGSTVFVYLPLINRAVAQFAPYAWNKPDSTFFYGTYRLLLDVGLHSAFILVEAGVVVYLYQRFKEHRAVPRAFPLHEFAAIVTLIAYPFIGYVIAVIRAGMISPRFVLPMCLGAAIAVAIAACRLFAESSIITVVLLFVTLSWALARNSYTASGLLLEQRVDFHNLQKELPREGTLVVPDSLLAFPLYYYSPPDTAARIVFPFDVKAIRRFKGEDSAEQNLWAGRRTFPLTISALNRVECSWKECHIVSPPGNWLIAKLEADGIPAKVYDARTNSRHLRAGGFLFSLSFGGEVLIYRPPR